MHLGRRTCTSLVPVPARSVAHPLTCEPPCARVWGGRTNQTPSRQVSFEALQLAPGDYTIVVCTFQAGRARAFRLQVFAPPPADLPDDAAGDHTTSSGATRTGNRPRRAGGRRGDAELDWASVNPVLDDQHGHDTSSNTLLRTSLGTRGAPGEPSSGMAPSTSGRVGGGSNSSAGPSHVARTSGTSAGPLSLVLLP